MNTDPKPAETPETDKAAFDVYGVFGGAKKLLEADLVPAAFARTLERQRDEARKKRDELQKDVHAACIELQAHDITEAGEMISHLLEGVKDAKGLATSIWKTEFSDGAPHWQPLPDLRGIISQIDNMYAGVRGQRDQARWDANQHSAKAGNVGKDPLDAAVKRMEAVLVTDIAQAWWSGQDAVTSAEAVRAKLIEAAKATGAQQ